MRKDFTASAERAISRAGEVALKLGTTAIGTEHLLYGLAAVNGTASRIMRENEVKKADILAALKEMSPGGTIEKVNRADCSITPKMENTVVSAEQIARKNGDGEVGTEHLLLAVLKLSLIHI